MSSQTPDVQARAGNGTQLTWRAASAVLLLAMGAIHLYLVFDAGLSGLIGTLFIVNAVGGLVLAIAMLATSGRLLTLVSAVSLLFLAGTLLALVLSLTLPGGFLGVREQLQAQLVTPTLIVEGIGVIVLLVTTMLLGRRRA